MKSYGIKTMGGVEENIVILITKLCMKILDSNLQSNHPMVNELNCIIRVNGTVKSLI